MQLLQLLVAFTLCIGAQSFTVPTVILSNNALCSHCQRFRLDAAASSSAPQYIDITANDLSEPERKVYDIMENMHQSNYKFRIVVIGKGAVLETSSILGPVMHLNQAGNDAKRKLLTLASEDRSFEMHLTLGEVSKVVFTQRETPAKTMRIMRLLNSSGESMCSLVLNDNSEEANKWFQSLTDEMGNEIQL